MLTLIGGVFVGLALGLTGAGGSILAVPFLVYVLGVPAVQATTISLAAVCLMALVGAVGATRSKMTEWRTTGLMSAGGLLAAPVGVQIASHLETHYILTGFSVLMVLIALKMGVQSFRTPDETAVQRVNYAGLGALQGPFCQFDDSAVLRLSAPCSIALFIAGIVTGLLSGIFGVGGGFLIVPALMFVTKMDIHRAVATSLSIIAVIGIAGVSAALLQGRVIDIPLTALFLAGGVAGMLGGRLLVPWISALVMQKIFALAVLILGLITLFF